MRQEHTTGHVGWSPDYKSSGPIAKSFKDFSGSLEEFMAKGRKSNYPTRTAQDLEIADLKRENNAAFERIQELSAELVRLGFDPTAKKL